MTGLERLHRFRQKRRETKPETKPAETKPEVAALRAEVAALTAQRDQALRAYSDAFARHIAAAKDIDRLTKELAVSRAASGIGEDAEAVIAKLTAKLAAAEAKLADPDGEIGKLRQRLATERAKVRAMADTLDRERRANPVTIAKRDLRKLQKVFHPDSSPTERQKTEATQIFNTLKLNVIGDD